MSTFDIVAKEWDLNPMHLKRTEAIAESMLTAIDIKSNWKALEFGAGTALLSFLLKDQLAEITLIDNSKEMINVCIEKCNHYKTKHIHPLYIDLENDNLSKEFDFIYSQMALHHIKDVELLLKKLYSMLSEGGVVAIADLYSEDGSFHGLDADVHKGFDPVKLSELFRLIGFKSVNYSQCYSLTRENGISYPIFLMVARKG